MPDNLRILFFGDIIGKIGRRAIGAAVKEYRAEFSPDLVIANAENAAHGAGITQNIFEELKSYGVDFFTMGDHVFDKPEGELVLAQNSNVIIRPANFPAQVPGIGFQVVDTPKGKVMVVNLLGQVFMKYSVDNPFIKIDEILQSAPADLVATVVDFHTEATSEIVAMGWHLDGRVSAVWGTHTHVPTADTKVLPNGTAFVSDVGMVGDANSVIGGNKEEVIKGFLGGTLGKFNIAESGEAQINAIIVDIDVKTGKAQKISRVDRKIKV